MIDSLPTLLEEESLRRWTTLRVGGAARFFYALTATEKMADALTFAQERALPVFVLGGGSNVLVSDSGFAGLVIHIHTAGCVVESDDGSTVAVRVAAGESWDAFVAHSVDMGWWGIENLSGIPGTVGAVPVQNVGAYGQEVSDTIVSVEAWNREASSWCTLTPEDCQFGYRQSVFNTSAIDQYIITQVTFRLQRRGGGCLDHVAVGEWLDRHACKNPSLRDLRRGILALRSDGRLPDVRATGNVGSFFKHVLLTSDDLERLRRHLADRMELLSADRLYELARRFRVGGFFKLPAGALIQACGAVGWQEGGAAQHERNPLVLVNRDGTASAKDVMRLAERIRDCVFENAGIELKIEPRCIGWEIKPSASRRERESQS